ncbi:hypothetical protein OG352_22605 [Streptomyces sp. NBC_01485]|uniref:hypothetical protein n=1 Tax=Streptomyces sp. NBC_01485 TaxID=2903884 RepID=UPI002E380B80|nr:hypothetical protein [Streptomyces sp. NBC_01485]
MTAPAETGRGRCRDGGRVVRRAGHAVFSYGCPTDGVCPAGAVHHMAGYDFVPPHLWNAPPDHATAPARTGGPGRWGRGRS